MANNNGHKRWLEIKAKRKMLECQWRRKSGEEAKECKECEDRFLCHTITAHKFHITENYAIYRTYEIYAENRQEAVDVLDKYNGDKDIAPVIKFGDEEDGDALIDELDYEGKVRYGKNEDN